MSRIFLIRHGQASWGKRNYDVLSTTGIRQSYVLGMHLKEWRFSNGLVISGSHKRHQDTAKFCLKSMYREPLWREDTRWNEFDFQDIIQCFKPIYKIHGLMVADLTLRGAPQENFKRIFEQSIHNWMNSTQDTIYKESWPAFKQRVLSALQSLTELHAHKDIFIFTSGGVIGVIVSHLLNLDIASNWRSITEKIVNTSITQLRLKKSQLSLISLNDHSHLLGKHANLYSTH